MTLGLNRYLRRLQSLNAVRKTQPRKNLTSRLLVEGLEDRTLPSTIALVGNVLTYSESSGIDHNITVSFTSGAPGTYTFTDNEDFTTAPPGWTIMNGTATGPDTGVASLSITTGGGIDTVIVDSIGHVVTTLDGGTGSNTLFGSNAPTTWNINGADTGNLSISGFGVDFTNFGSLTGGLQTDTFVFMLGGSVSGIINGGGGALDDTLDYSGLAGPLNVMLTGVSPAHGFQGSADIGFGMGGTFNNIGAIIGTSGVNTLTGANLTNTWTLTATNMGMVSSGTQSLAFTSFSNLVGGLLTDTFIFMAGGSSSPVAGMSKHARPVRSAMYGLVVTPNRSSKARRARRYSSSSPRNRQSSAYPYQASCSSGSASRADFQATRA
jgi:hypothetical protein